MAVLFLLIIFLADRFFKGIIHFDANTKVIIM